MESLELRVFREVAYEQSITKAAEKLGYVQSNVTAHIRRLEAELDLELFVRHSKGVTLTDKGQQLLLYANQVVALLDNAKLLLRRQPDCLRIGATQTIAGSRLPQWLAAYQQLYPNVELEAITQPQDELLAAVADGRLQGAFVHTGWADSRLTAVLRYREPLVLAAGSAVGTKEELAEAPIVVTSMEGCPYKALLEKWMMQLTLRQPTVIRFDTVEGILRAVSLGMGITLLPVGIIPLGHHLQLFNADDIGQTEIELVAAKARDASAFREFVEVVRSG